jgi:hypothetical protein
MTSLNLTKPFRLPGLFPPSNVANTEACITSGKRVINYLPPPISPELALSILRPEEGSRAPTSPLYCSAAVETGGKEKPAKVQDKRKLSPALEHGAASYPSPGRSRIIPASDRDEDVKSHANTSSTPLRVLQEGNTVVNIYRPPSPPTSDPPVTSNGNDVRIQVDLRIVRENCPQIKNT